MKKNLYWFAFFVPPRDAKHNLFWHQLRDGEGGMFLREAFSKAGVDGNFSGVIRNVPDAPPPRVFGPNDILIATTRFPLDDDENEDGRTVVPGNNELERLLGIPRSGAPKGAACLFFRQLNRSCAVLQDRLAVFLKPPHENRDDVRFSNKRGARCVQYRRGRDIPAETRRTAAYLVNIPSAWPGGPGLVWSFGVSGETGLVWNKLVCDEFSRFLREPYFVMAEFDIPARLREKDQEDYGPGGFDWVTTQELNVTVVAEIKLAPDVLQVLGF
jgi:hypothetical protein